MYQIVSNGPEKNLYRIALHFRHQKYNNIIQYIRLTPSISLVLHNITVSSNEIHCILVRSGVNGKNSQIEKVVDSKGTAKECH